MGSTESKENEECLQIFDKQVSTFALSSVASKALYFGARHLRSPELPAALCFAAARHLQVAVFAERTVTDA